MRSRIYAEAVQLYLEYNPQPPFNAGSPKTANAEANKFTGERLAPLSVEAAKIAKEINRK